jgi:hypothetical protein
MCTPLQVMAARSTHMEKLKLGKLKYSIEDVCDIANECRSNVVRAVKLGHLPSFTVGKKKYIRPADVVRWVDFLQAQSDAGRPIRYQARDEAARPGK